MSGVRDMVWSREKTKFIGRDTLLALLVNDGRYMSPSIIYRERKWRSAGLQGDGEPTYRRLVTFGDKRSNIGRLRDLAVLSVWMHLSNIGYSTLKVRELLMITAKFRSDFQLFGAFRVFESFLVRGIYISLSLPSYWNFRKKNYKMFSKYYEGT